MAPGHVLATHIIMSKGFYMVSGDYLLSNNAGEMLHISPALGHGGVVGISAGQPSEHESEGREFESRHAPRFMSNMLAPRD